MSSGTYKVFGSHQGVEIQRFQHANGQLSGVLFNYNEGLMTAGHVVENNTLEGFVTHPLDLGYKRTNSQGLPLGYIDSFLIEEVTLIASKREEPTTLVPIKGRISIWAAMPTHFSPFQPDNPEEAKEYFKSGLSGSPLLYQNHIIAVAAKKNNHNPYEVGVLSFNSRRDKKALEEIGLSFREISNH